jgi:hypothetical protein
MSSSRDDLIDRSACIHWPDGLDPDNADLFAHNAIVIDAPAGLDLSGHVRLDVQERGPAAWSLRRPGRSRAPGEAQARRTCRMLKS